MLISTLALTDAALDWAVAVSRNERDVTISADTTTLAPIVQVAGRDYQPTHSNWQADPIIAQGWKLICEHLDTASSMALPGPELREHMLRLLVLGSVGVEIEVPDELVIGLTNDGPAGP